MPNDGVVAAAVIAYERFDDVRKYQTKPTKLRLTSSVLYACVIEATSRVSALSIQMKSADDSLKMNERVFIKEI